MDTNDKLLYDGTLKGMPEIYLGTRLELFWSQVRIVWKFMTPFHFWELCDFIAFNNCTDPDQLLDYDDIVDYLFERGWEGLCEKLGLGLPCGNKVESYFSDFDPTPAKRARLEFVAQSQDIQNDVTPNPVEQNTEFLDEAPGSVYDLHTDVDATYSQSDESSLNDLSGFLRRTVPVFTATWTINTPLSVRFYPWENFLKDSAIIRKIDHYMLFRANGMRLHFKINGSPFHYGRVYAGFSPTTQPNFYPPTVTPINSNVIATNGSGMQGMDMPKCTFSQQPGVNLDPTTNQPEELTIPFFFPLNYVDLRYEDQLRRLGEINIWTLEVLQHANGGTDPVNIQVFASLIDPVLTMPYQQLSFVGQSLFFQAESSFSRNAKSNNRKGASNQKGSKPRKGVQKTKSSNSSKSSGNDEYGSGIISAPASALAKFAGYFEAVPVIGSYATATKIGASAVGKIANLFGYSRPVQLEPSKFFRPRPFGHMAVTEIEDTIPKLTFDPKQELCVDPATTGLESTDAMALAHIWGRESLIAKGQWNETSDPGTVILAWKVHPCNYPVSNLGTEFIHCPSALGWAVLPFMHWRGSIEYRITIVASQMHRGRLAIQYSPTVSNQTANWNTELSTTKYFTEIVDLTEGRDYTFCVNYAQPNPWLEVAYDYADTAAVVTSASSDTTATNFHNCNGLVTIRVVTELGSPRNGEHVRILVYARAGRDFMVRNPTDENISTLSYDELYSDAEWAGESLFFQAESADYIATEENAPCQEQVVVLNGSTPGYDPEDISAVFFGEQIVSVRNIIKRYSMLMPVSINGGSQNDYTYDVIRFNNLPPRPGLAIGINYATTVKSTNPYAFVQWTFLRYYMHGYAGYRGGVRWKVMPYNRDQGIGQSYIFVKRDTKFREGAPPSNGYIFAAFNYATDNGTSTATQLQDVFYQGINAANGPMPASVAGTDYAFQCVNGGIEFEVPFQSNLRFVYCNEIATTAAARSAPTAGDLFAFTDWQRHNWEAHAMGFVVNNNAVMRRFNIYCGAGEDFSLFFFINAPIMYTRVQPV